MEKYDFGAALTRMTDRRRLIIDAKMAAGEEIIRPLPEEGNEVQPAVLKVKSAKTQEANL